MKNPLTSAGIEPATFRFVAQNLNHCATAVPQYIMITIDVKTTVRHVVSLYDIAVVWVLSTPPIGTVYIYLYRCTLHFVV